MTTGSKIVLNGSCHHIGVLACWLARTVSFGIFVVGVAASVRINTSLAFQSFRVQSIGEAIPRGTTS